MPATPEPGPRRPLTAAEVALTVRLRKETGRPLLTCARAAEYAQGQPARARRALAAWAETPEE